MVMTVLLNLLPWSVPIHLASCTRVLIHLLLLLLTHSLGLLLLVNNLVHLLQLSQLLLLLLLEELLLLSVELVVAG